MALTHGEAPAPPPVTHSADDADLGPRAARTREAILDAARKLFLERGYAGTRINNITDACGISRAGFYTYFKDKHDVVDVLGRNTYADCLKVIGEWDTMARPTTYEDIRAWVKLYFDFMDEHGAFMYALTQSGPRDEEFRATALRLQLRVWFLLGGSLRGRQKAPTHAPEALGMTTLAMIEQSWSHLRVRRFPVAERDVIDMMATSILRMLTSPAHPDER